MQSIRARDATANEASIEASGARSGETSQGVSMMMGGPGHTVPAGSARPLHTVPVSIRGGMTAYVPTAALTCPRPMPGGLGARALTAYELFGAERWPDRKG